MIHSDEYADWKNHPVTEAFFNDISQGKQTILNSLTSGEVLDSHPKIARFLGMIEMCDAVVGYRPEFNKDGYMIDVDGKVME